jgi:hypothetical protein
MRGRALFQKVVEMCGVSGVLGPGLVRRALQNGEAAPEDAGPEDYQQALPELRKRLATYLPPDEADRRLRRIAGMLAHATGELGSEDEESWSTFGRVVEVLRQANPGLDRAAADAAEDADAEREALFQTGERLKDGVTLPPKRGTGNGE